jgi:hypothetical protein
MDSHLSLGWRRSQLAWRCGCGGPPRTAAGERAGREDQRQDGTQLRRLIHLRSQSGRRQGSVNRPAHIELTPMRAWLNGVGAMTLASALVFPVLFELWSRGILQFPEGRPTFEVAGLPAYAFGAAIAVRAGGWRGLLALVVLAEVAPLSWTIEH